MSGLPALAKPRRIKASHRRRWRIASGQSVQRYYDPQIGRFLSVDPVTAYEKPMTNFNRYAYAFNNPYKFTDPDGRDGANFYTDPNLKMAQPNLTPKEAGFAIVAQAAVLLGPLAPEAVGAIRAFVAARNAASSSEGPTVAGVQVGKTPSETRAALEKAGYEGTPISNPSGTETGTLHNVPGMKMDVRVMNGGPKHEPRVVTNRQGTSQPVNPENGRNFGNIPKAEQNAKSHIPLKPDKVN